MSRSSQVFLSTWQINVSPPPAVRLGLGYCYDRLGQPRLAQASLGRALEMQEDCVDAMVGLAVIYLNDDQVSCEHAQAPVFALTLANRPPPAPIGVSTCRPQVDQALSLLKRAYDLEPNNPSVLNYLANHSFYRADYEKVRMLRARKLHSCGCRCHTSQKPRSHSDPDQAKSSSVFHL